MKTLRAALGAALLALAGCAHTSVSSASDVRLQSPEGQSFELQQLSGKVVLLDFWATWCEPCKRTLPETQQLAERFGARGLSAFAVNVERSGDAATFLRELNVALPLLRDPDGAQAEALGGNSLPFAVLFDKRGRVRVRQQGAVDNGQQKLAEQIEKLLGE